MSDTRSLDELFVTATDFARAGSSNDFADWAAVEALHNIGSREVLTRALALTSAQDPRTRARGLDILAQLGKPERAFPVECLAAIVRLAESDGDAEVLCSASSALGHYENSGGVAPLVRLAGHENPQVRASVALALEGRTHRDLVAAAVRLTKDQVADVRHRAMAALGLSAYLGSTEAREALFACLTDAAGDLREAAILGLARCRDPRVVAPLLKELTARPQDHNLAIAAFRFLGLPENADMPPVEELIKRLQAAG
jgi:HEAT repeat protein